MLKYLEEQNPDIEISAIKGLKFSTLSDDAISANSAVTITKSQLYVNNEATEYGIFDFHLGSTDENVICKTCGFNKRGCNGHPGHFELKYPVIQPLYINYIRKFIKIFCHQCNNFVINRKVVEEIVRNFKRNRYARDNFNNYNTPFTKKYFPFSTKNIDEGGDLEIDIPVDLKLIEAKIVSGKCFHCDADLLKFIKTPEKDLFIYYAETNKLNQVERKIFYTHLIKDFLGKINLEDILLLGITPNNHPKNCILSKFYIPSNTIRPDIRFNSADKFNSDQIPTYLQVIIKYNENITPVFKTDKEISSENIDRIRQLNVFIYSLILGNTNIDKRIIHGDFKPIVERFRSKSGIIRGNILGRRVHDMARAVIVCNPLLPLDTIRIPICFAKKLQIKEIVNEYNFDILTIHVRNGITKWPGATKVRKTKINRDYLLYFAKDIVLERGDIVYRDLRDDDVVFFNRQPSTIYSNITTVKVLVDTDPKSFVIEMNVLICHFFHADFDGDQMSIILINSIISRFEAFNLASVSKLTVSKQYSNANIGQGEDTIIGSFLMSREHTMISKVHAARILSNTRYIEDLDKVLDELFDGKDRIRGNDLFSVALPEALNYTGGSEWVIEKYKNIPGKYKDYEKSIKIVNGKIIHGILDKKSIKSGASNSLYQAIENQYSDPTKVLNCVFNMQQLCLQYTLYEGFSISIKDLIVSNENLKEIRTKQVREKISDLDKLIYELHSGTLKVPVGYTLKEYFTELYLNKVEGVYINAADVIDFEDNKMFQMIQSGSKGKMSVMLQLLGTIGMVKVLGNMPPETFSYARTLPYFQRYSMTPEALAFVKNSYISGMTSPEIIFSSMQARQDIISRALMTAVSGYQSRQAIKTMESNTVNNLRIVKNNTHIIQLLYGGDNFETTKTVKCSLHKHYGISDVLFKERFHYSDGEFKVLMRFKTKIKEIAINYQYYQMLFNSFETVYKINTPIDIDIMINSLRDKLNPKHAYTTLEKDEMVGVVNTLCDNLPYLYFNVKNRNNSFLSKLPECYKYGMFYVEAQIRIFLCVKECQKRGITKPILLEILEMIQFKILKSLVIPGAPVGIISAQCVTEPITQANLDSTRGAASVTTVKKTGMERVKEILGVKASAKIHNLSMLIQLKYPLNLDKELNEKISNNLEMLVLQQFIKKFQIFFEEPLAPEYLSHEKAMVDKFLKINRDVYVPSNLTKFNIRMEINKEMLFNKYITLNEIIEQLQIQFPNDLVVYTPQNSEDVIIRMYISEFSVLMDKRNKTNIDLIIKNLQKILLINIRGVRGIKKSLVVQTKKEFFYDSLEDKIIDNATQDNSYVIVTTGVNMYEIFFIDEIDERSIQFDDINLYLEIFGIEHTKSKIMYELKDTIDESLNPKHFELVADNMTRHGILTSFEKTGLNKREKDNILLRLGTSHPKQVIEEAVLSNGICSTDGITSSLMVGQAPTNYGTTMNELFVDTDMVKKTIR
jgi:DNA-directed RNA polymerase II subunit RPB1